MIQQKTVFEASDGSTFGTEEAARDYELRLELNPLIEAYLDENFTLQRARRHHIADLMMGFAVQLLSPPSPGEKDRPGE